MKIVVNVSEADLAQLEVSVEELGAAVARSLRSVDLEGGDRVYLDEPPHVEVVVAQWSSEPAAGGYRVKN